MSQMQTIVASPPDRDKLVVMIDCDNEQWAEINQESGKLILEIYPRVDNKPWVFDYEQAVKVLVGAKKDLREESRKSKLFPKRPWWKLF